MLPLNDPLWKQLDDAHRDRDIPALLASLSRSWDRAAANSLFWDCLCHQDTCYGATYAAVPHLLDIAEVESNRQQRFEIGVFAGYVALRALKSQSDDDAALPGLPETPDAWDQKLDCFRDLAARLEDGLKTPGGHVSHHERNNLLPRYKSILRAGIPADMDRIRMIKAAFLSALPRIGKICEQAFQENTRNENALVPLLGGIAAAEGQITLSALLFSGTDGSLTCAHCNAGYQYILFGNRMALYADDATGSSALADGASNLDHREGAASRADGFVTPVEDRLTTATLRLLVLADGAQVPLPAVLLRNFLGSFRCKTCSTDVPVCPA